MSINEIACPCKCDVCQEQLHVFVLSMHVCVHSRGRRASCLVNAAVSREAQHRPKSAKIGWPFLTLSGVPILAGFSRCWLILASFGRCWPMLADVSRFWLQIMLNNLADFSRFQVCPERQFGRWFAQEIPPRRVKTNVSRRDRFST